MARKNGARTGLILLLGGIAACTSAERLPIHSFSSADGLLEDGAVQYIFQDSAGYIWSVTVDGLSRFDGQAFRTYGTSEGLNDVSQMIEADGVYWIAGAKGVIRYDPRQPEGKRFPNFPVAPDRRSNEINWIAADGHGGLWIATWGGVYFAKPDAKALNARLEFKPQFPPNAEPEGSAPAFYIFVDSRGVIWATDHHALYRSIPGGSVTRFSDSDGLPHLTAGPVLEDHAGRMWLATSEALIELDPSPGPGHPLVRRRIDTRIDGKLNLFLGICETPDGRIWGATHKGLLEFDGTRLRVYTRANGLTEDALWSVAADRHGNLWLGTAGSGIMRFTRDGFTTMTDRDGLTVPQTRAVQNVGLRELAVTSGNSGGTDHVWTGDHFRTVRPLYPEGATRNWGFGQLFARDSAGDTWAATYRGLARFENTRSLAAIDRRAPTRLYNTRDGAPCDSIGRVFLDSHGDVWFGCTFPSRDAIARWIRRSDRIEDLSSLLPAKWGAAARAFAEDSSGLWIGGGHGLVRWQNGTFTAIESDLPTGKVQSLYVDERGSVWGASEQNGAFRIDDARGAKPRFTWFADPEVPASTDAVCVTGDRAGHVYIGTLGGVSEVTLATGEIQSFSTGDGLGSNVVTSCDTDSAGHPWFATSNGVSRLNASSRADREIAPARITAVQIGDRALDISDLGDLTVTGPTLPNWRNNLRVAFGGIDSSGRLRYRYRLRGSNEGWSKPSQTRFVNFASVSPGSYRFEVEAMLGLRSGPPAVFSFVILPPYWQRWWFLTSALLVAALMGYAAYRLRVNQLLAVERMRNAISADLHDEIGSSLTRIAVGLEVTRQRLGSREREVSESLGHVAGLARDTTSSMANIVWAVNPLHDSLGSLTARIRRFSTEVLEASDIECKVTAPESEAEMKLDIESRGQIFLIVKEAVHNAVRHARPTAVEIELRVESGAQRLGYGAPQYMTLRISDNGSGFDEARIQPGHGLSNMRARAERLKGKLTVTASPGSGCTIELRVPLRH